MPSPRFIKSHLPLQLLPNKLNTINPKVYNFSVAFVCGPGKQFDLKFFIEFCLSIFRSFMWRAIQKICVYRIITIACWFTVWSVRLMNFAKCF